METSRNHVYREYFSATNEFDKHGPEHTFLIKNLMKRVTFNFILRASTAKC